ncbi:MAG: zinc ribbon domain-containing protein [Thermoleophilia bacterium]|nr:zinc ribbon domain-containing protein [Thermoleophilia bacterium]
MDNFFATINKIINSPVWILAFYVFLFCVVVLWLSLVFWTLKDARKRIEDPLVVAVAVATSFILPFMGTLVYAILRPAEYLAEARERELEMRAMEQELQALRACPSCGELVRPDYLVCPSCRRRLRSSCPTCGRVLEPGWKICPYCAQELKVRRVPPPLEEPARPSGLEEPSGVAESR